MLDRHVAQQIHGTKSTKSCQINRSQKFFGALFVGNFRNREEHDKNRLENEVWGSKIVRNLCSRYHNDTGWNPNQRIFHVWRLAHDEHGESQGKDGGNTRGKHSINTKAITQMLDSRYKVEIHDPRSTTVIQIVFSRRRS